MSSLCQFNFSLTLPALPVISISLSLAIPFPKLPALPALPTFDLNIPIPSLTLPALPVFSISLSISIPFPQLPALPVFPPPCPLDLL